MAVTLEAIDAALATVEDPEIRKPITELEMVKSRSVSPDGHVDVAVWLTVASCPMRDTIITRVRDAVQRIPGVVDVAVELDVMSDDQRKALRGRLVGHAEREIVFNKPGSTTKVYAIVSGKGGVGKSSLTANLAVALAAQGARVGLVDADIYGHSIPRMLGVTAAPTMVEGMIMPPSRHGVTVISMLAFKPGGVHQPVAFRGPMLHRALQQFLADVWWGDLDVLLLDLPPGTGDIAISLAQLLPGAQLIVVTTPQQAAADVAIRAGLLAEQTKQRVIGVIENMSAVPCPHCGEPLELFGSGGGTAVAKALSDRFGTTIPLLGHVPFDVRLRIGADEGEPLLNTDRSSPAAEVLFEIADGLRTKPLGLAGKLLDLSPTGR